VKPPLPPVAILCGGLGTRLQSLGVNLPKALMELNGEPFIAHQLRLLQSRGIERVVLCLGHLGDRISDYVGDGSRFGLQARFSFDGPVLLGTAGAIRRALPLLSQVFFVLYGDSYLPCDYRSVAEAFYRSRRPALMTVFRNEGKYDTSNVEFDGTHIVAYDKASQRPRMHYIDYGLGVFDRSAFEHIPEGQSCDLAEIYQQQLAAGQLTAFEVKQRFYEIGSVRGLQETAEYLRNLDSSSQA
jgi:N-acetyl-alpha-D-muramate 1-phosphate uridylyltransferase